MRKALRPKLLVGMLLLSEAMPASVAAPAQESRSGRWTLADFGGVLSVGLEGHRNYRSGLEHYRSLCANCHTLGKHGDGTAPDLTYARGIPDTPHPDQSTTDKKLCTLILLEVGFCRDQGCDKKHNEKTEKYYPLIAAFKKH